MKTVLAFIPEYSNRPECLIKWLLTQVKHQDLKWNIAHNLQSHVSFRCYLQILVLTSS